MLVKGLLQKTLLALVPLVGLTACQPDKPQKQAENTKITYDTPIKGEITTSSPINFNDGSRYQLIPMRLSAGQTARISLEGALPGRVTLLHEGSILATSQSVCCSEEVSKPAYLIAHSEVDAEYLLSVSGINANSFGPFVIKASAANIRTGGPLQLDEKISGWLNGVHPAGATEGHVYNLTVTEAAPYSFTLRSSEFDAFLKLSGNQIETSDDDSAGGSDARLTVLLEPGNYELNVSTWASRASGIYTLHTTKINTPVVKDGEINIGQSNEAFLIGGQRDDYRLVVEEAGSYVFDLESDHFDTVLIVRGTDVEEADDDGGNNYNSRLELDLPAGNYTVTAASINDTGGVYRLSVQK